MRTTELYTFSQDTAHNVLPESDQPGPIDAVSCRRPPCDMAPTCEQEGVCLAARPLTEAEFGAALGSTCFVATIEPASQN